MELVVEKIVVIVKSAAQGFAAAGLTSTAVKGNGRAARQSARAGVAAAHRRGSELQ